MFLFLEHGSCKYSIIAQSFLGTCEAFRFRYREWEKISTKSRILEFPALVLDYMEGFYEITREIV